MIENNELIAVAVSGGKDSLVAIANIMHQHVINHIILKLRCSNYR